MLARIVLQISAVLSICFPCHQQCHNSLPLSASLSSPVENRGSLRTEAAAAELGKGLLGTQRVLNESRIPEGMGFATSYLAWAAPSQPVSWLSLMPRSRAVVKIRGGRGNSLPRGPPALQSLTAPTLPSAQLPPTATAQDALFTC